MSDPNLYAGLRAGIERLGSTSRSAASTPAAKASPAKASPAKASTPKPAIDPHQRAAAIDEGRREVRAAIRQVLASPDSRGVEREAMTALAAGAKPDLLLADLADRNSLVTAMRARYAKDGE
jgi:hypothetical protein